MEKVPHATHHKRGVAPKRGGVIAVPRRSVSNAPKVPARSKTPKRVTTASSDLMLNAVIDFDKATSARPSRWPLQTQPYDRRRHKRDIARWHRSDARPAMRRPSGPTVPQAVVSVPTVQPEHMVFHYRKAPSQAWRWHARSTTRPTSRH
jgi:hypothetical protein